MGMPRKVWRACALLRFGARAHARRRGRVHTCGSPLQKVRGKKKKSRLVQVSSEMRVPRARALPRRFQRARAFAASERLRSLAPCVHCSLLPPPHQVRAASAAARLESRCALSPTLSSVQKRCKRPQSRNPNASPCAPESTRLSAGDLKCEYIVCPPYRT